VGSGVAEQEATHCVGVRFDDVVGLSMAREGAASPYTVANSEGE
jgi:hypothetical protein